MGAQGPLAPRGGGQDPLGPPGSAPDYLGEQFFVWGGGGQGPLASGVATGGQGGAIAPPPGSGKWKIRKFAIWGKMTPNYSAVLDFDYQLRRHGLLPSVATQRCRGGNRRWCKVGGGRWQAPWLYIYASRCVLNGWAEWVRTYGPWDDIGVLDEVKTRRQNV